MSHPRPSDGLSMPRSHRRSMRRDCSTGAQPMGCPGFRRLRGTTLGLFLLISWWSAPPSSGAQLFGPAPIKLLSVPRESSLGPSAVGDFNSDGVPDLAVTDSRFLEGTGIVH